MRRLLVGAVLVLALAGCTSPPPPMPSPTVERVDDAQILGNLRARLCTTNNPVPWDTCVTAASQYLSLSVQIYDEMVAAGTATPELGVTAEDLRTLLERCQVEVPTEQNTRPCQYTFDTIRSTGHTFQQQLVAVK